MPKERTSVLDHLLRGVIDASDIAPSTFTVIVERLEEAVSASGKEEVDGLAHSLTSAFKRLLAKAPEATSVAARRLAAADPSVLAAFNLGHIGLAQQFAAQVAGRRADDRFVQTIKDGVLAPYARALAAGDMTGRELAEAVGEADETVSRKLKKLREIGIADFRKDGTSCVNFLTPAARSVIGPQPDYETRSPRSAAKHAALQKCRERLPPHMRQLPVLDASQTPLLH